MKKDSIKWYCFYHYHMNFEVHQKERVREKRKMTLTQQNLALHTALKREKELSVYIPSNNNVKWTKKNNNSNYEASWKD